MLLRPIALSVFALLAASTANAQSKLTLNGEIDIAIGSFEISGLNPKALTKVDSNSMSTSWFGMSGTEDLGNGLKAGFDLQSFLRPDTGASGRAAPDTFWARNANVYLSGGFGKLTIGRQTPVSFLTVVRNNPFGGAFGVSPAIRLTFGAFGNYKGDSGWGNTIGYTTPAMGGFSATAQVQASETPGTGTSTILGAGYKAGAFSIEASVNTTKSATGIKAPFNAGEKQTFNLLGANYDFGMFKAFGLIGKIKDTGFAANLDTSLYQVGVSIPVTAAGKILASYGASKEKATGVADVKHSIFSLGYDHFLSKRTDIYTVYMLDDEKVTGFKTGSTFMVGLRHKF